VTDSNRVSVSQARIDAVLQLLAYISIGEFDPARLRLEPSHPEDAFSAVEATLNVFVHELAETYHKNQSYMRSLEQAQRELEDKLTTIEDQRITIGELSTPIIEVWHRILTLPVVGAVDAHRAAVITEKLLRRIVDTGARCVVIDVTGVEAIDTANGALFIRVVRAAELLGTHCVITGIGPQVAQNLVALGVDLEGVITLGTLKDGLKHCFRFLRR
jgi:rsbT co-antagonist protein RsbR